MDNVADTLNTSFPEKGDSSYNAHFMAEEEYSWFTRITIGPTFIVAVFGVIANVFNIRTFYRLGLKDGIAVTLFGLSICDLCYLLFYVGMRIMLAFIILEEEGVVWLYIHPSVFSAHIAGLALVASYTGMFAVTFLAVARCLCVSMPLHFKHIFTKFRCVAFYIVFIIMALSGYIPLIVTTGVNHGFDQQKNKTRIYLCFTAEREKVKEIVWLIFGTISPVVAEVTLIACVFVMTSKLRESAKFRHSQRSHREDDNNIIKVSTLNRRERRVVHQVLLISIIYIVLNVIKIFNSLYTQFEPKYNTGKKYQNIYFMMSDLRFFFDCVNCTVNFLIYYKFNSAFRAECFKTKSKSVSRQDVSSSSCQQADTVTTKSIDISILERDT